MPEKITVYGCVFCSKGSQFTNSAEAVVAMHERNRHPYAMFRVQLKEAVHVIASSGKDPRNVTIFPLTKFPPKVQVEAVKYWTENIAPNLHSR